ncbi:MAG TPA: hypothetical protein VEK80_14805 [Kribbellaceae bacterium]|nr:hypothetical protein [Kribbellaceae bacterium]
MSTGTRRNTGLAAVAVAAAVAAVVTVLVSAAVAGQRFATRETADPTSAPPTLPTTPSISYQSGGLPTASAFPDGQVRFSDPAENAYFEVPATKDGWVGAGPLDYVEAKFPESYVGPKPWIINYVTLDRNFCKPKDEVHINYRAIAGFGVPAADTDDVKGAHLRVVRSWRVGLAHDDPGAPAPKVGAPRQVELADGTAWRTDLVTTGDGDRCDAPKTKMSIVSLDTGSGVSSMILVHDVGQKGDITDAEAEKILMTFGMQEK